MTENTYMGRTTLRLTISEGTRVNLREDDSSVPFIEDFCLSVKQLLNVGIGEVANVICLVKVLVFGLRIRIK